MTGYATVTIELEHCAVVNRDNIEEACASETETSDYWTNVGRFAGLMQTYSQVDMKNNSYPMQEMIKYVPIGSDPLTSTRDTFKFDVNEFTDKNDKLGLFLYDVEPVTFLTDDEP